MLLCISAVRLSLSVCPSVHRSFDLSASVSVSGICLYNSFIIAHSAKPRVGSLVHVCVSKRAFAYCIYHLSVVLLTMHALAVEIDKMFISGAVSGCISQCSTGII